MFKYIVIDTNILFNDFDLTKVDLRKLIKFSSIYKINICFPQVVIDELIGQYSQKFDDEVDSLIKSFDALQKTLLTKKINSFNVDETSKDLRKRKEQYEHHLYDFIKKHRITVLPYPKEDHSEIVRRMYLKKHPFTNDKVELGYKDYLIAVSAKKKQSKRNQVILYTKNLKDFCKLSNKNSKELEPFHSDFEATSCFATDNLSVILQSLRNQQARRLKKLSLEPEKIDSLFDKFGREIVTNILFSDDAFGDITFEVEIIENTFISKSVEFSVDIDKEWDLFHLKGIVEISFSCNFELDNYSFEMLDKDFVFYDLVVKALESKGIVLNSEEEWSYKFYDFNYHKKFDISYEIFDYQKPEDVDVYDEFALSIYPLH
ncbi:DUF4935 domain-containing protein [Pontibacterium sp. N1Y112]|uniref:DUF4935 domain-containing protein n=1 Tax=Pontibacterium sinense TaxID=2781979 RepID=A0A8J7K7I3_9GAMM|nr:PIN domain-containing protein [Pontibacterium sinense]MBE9398291.1 DUF4935 domain-containing protein [Pontibacterium sinense]